MVTLLISAVWCVHANAVTQPEGLTGLWYDPSSDGEGFNILVSDSTVTIFYYGYAGGKPRWTLTSELATSAVTLGEWSEQLQLSAADDGEIGHPTRPESLESYGTLRIRFASCNSADADLRTSDGDRLFALVKLAGVSGNDQCAPPVQCGTEQAVSFTHVDGELTDSARSRIVPYRVFYPTGSVSCTPIVLVSHGGTGNTFGHTRFDHIGESLASLGYVTVHINHRPSTARAGMTAGETHLVDRPSDASFLLDALLAGQIAIPQSVQQAIDVNRIGHVGHSYGAYTSHVLAGAQTEQGNFRDPRIRAIVPLSPQGEGQFGFFGHEQMDNSWNTITVPSLIIVGSQELDSNAVRGFIATDWRLQPFANYPRIGDKLQIVLSDLDHGDIGSQGSPETKAYIAESVRRFFDTYLRGMSSQSCQIGIGGSIRIAQFDQLIDPLGVLVLCNN